MPLISPPLSLSLSLYMQELGASIGAIGKGEQIHVSVLISRHAKRERD